MGESVAKSKESIKRKTRKRKQKEIKHSGRSTLKMVYQNLFETFGALFFLGKKYVYFRNVIKLKAM